MNNREDWTPEELALQKALDRIREEHPDFWNDIPPIPKSVLEARRQREAEQEERDRIAREAAREEVRVKKLRRRNRRRIIAVCFVAVCVLSVSLTIFWNSDTAHAMKFAMEKKYYQSKGWIQATDSEMVNDENVMLFDITDELRVSQGSELWEDLLAPTYITNKYRFELLHIEKYITGDATATYVYNNSVSRLTILVNNYGLQDNNQIWITSEEVRDGTSFYRTWEDDITGINGLDMIIDDLVVSVYGSENLDELIRIGNGLQ